MQNFYSTDTKIFNIKKVKNQRKWTYEEDQILIKLAEQYGEKRWKDISFNFQNKNALQCFSRYKRIRPGIVKGSWTKEEDRMILALVNQHGKCWSKISKAMTTRNGKQIRDRFLNVLDTEIQKGKFTKSEDIKLLHLYSQLGAKWATIAKFFPNRTADMIKNRFHSSIKKKFDTKEFKINNNNDQFESSVMQSVDCIVNNFTKIENFEETIANIVQNLKADTKDSINNLNCVNNFEEKSDSYMNSSTGEVEVIKPEHVYYKRNFSSLSLNKDNYGHFNSTAESFYTNKLNNNMGNFEDFFGL